jgi:cell fate (sporulation/competence/biofilm development) regulator YlbF (YheA/YmcA/DUF963 family)
MERRHLNQARESRSRLTQQEGIISKEIKISSQTKKIQDFVKLECEGTYKEHSSNHLSEAEPSLPIVASQEQQVHKAGLTDHSQEPNNHRIKEKLDKYFKNFVENFKRIEVEANNTELREEFLAYKRDIEELHYKLGYSLKVANLAEADKCVEECESRERAFEAYLKEQKRLRDTSIEAFRKAFKTKISNEGNGRFFVESVAKQGAAFYQNIIDVDKGQIRGMNNKKYHTKNWHLSDVVYNQLQLVLKEAGKDISQFDLKNWYGNNIVNGSTEHIAEILLGENLQKTFKAGSNEFNAIKDTATAKSKFYLLDQHREDFRGKQVTSMTVIRNNNGGIDINYAIGYIGPH